MAQTAFMLALTFTLEISLLLSAKAVNTCHGSVRKKISAGWQQESQQTAAFSFHELFIVINPFHSGSNNEKSYISPYIVEA